MTTALKSITAEELLAMGDIGRCELIDGEIVRMAPAGADHGSLAARLLIRIGNFVEKHGLGRVFAAETGFIISRNPDTARAPDVGFVRTARVPKSQRRGYFEGAPDLAVEVVSPSDTKSELTAKADAWLAAGAISVWLADPANKSIEIYRSGNQIVRYRLSDQIENEPTLPGFALSVADVFAD